jgi:hypothetical protein
MTHSDKQKPTSKRPDLRIVQSSLTDEAESPQAEASSSSDSTTSSTSTEPTSPPSTETEEARQEREEFLKELDEFITILRDASQSGQITGIAFITINDRENTTGTAYTMSCKYSSHLTIAGIETLRYRFLRTFMVEQ